MTTLTNTMAYGYVIPAYRSDFEKVKAFVASHPVEYLQGGTDDNPHYVIGASLPSGGLGDEYYPSMVRELYEFSHEITAPIDALRKDIQDFFNVPSIGAAQLLIVHKLINN